MKISDFLDDVVHSNQRTLSIAGVRLPWPWPIAYALGSSSAVVFGCPVFGTDAPRVIKWFYRAFYRIERAKYWLMYRLHPRYRYHLIDTGLGYGYHERDDQLLHASMAILIGYVEDCESTGCHDPGDEARAILHWWRIQRPADQGQYNKWVNELYGGESRMKFKPVEGQPKLQKIVFDPLSEDDDAKQKALWALDEKIHADEQAFLHKLIDIRPSMWT